MIFVRDNEIKGDYLEFGVHDGGSFSSAIFFAKKYGLNDMVFLAFNSFEGLPNNKEGMKLLKGGGYACDLEQFKTNIRKRGADLTNKVRAYKGWFKDLEKWREKIGNRKASIIYIDGDLYQSAVEVLKFINGYLQEGTLLIFDDWNLFKGNPNQGEQRALKEWLKTNPKIRLSEFLRFGYHGNSFIISKAPA
ncbi:hypothetical protein AUJ84_02095 [Candidatus Pacearchaeota archaeon CG1_02_32_132]|nr:MAG: hypothetical protein AUJ84_02095 [Candidatus Pacearchaeota archaeon CG1_02_32_132]